MVESESRNRLPTEQPKQKSNRAMSWTLAIVLIATLVSTVQVGVGIWLGRCLFAPARHRPEEDNRGEEQEQRLQRLASRLYRLVTRVAGDVGEHQDRIEEVSRDLAGVQAGESSPLTEVFLQAVTRAVQLNQWLQKRLAEAEEQLQKQARQVEAHMAEARTDPLTRLPNRRAFDDAVAGQMQHWDRQHKPFSLLIVDVDHFKRLNDRLGHPAGDLVLQQLGQLLRRTFRTSDIVCRIGGEEFAVVLPGTPLATAARIGERVRELVETSAFELENGQTRTTISLGVAEVLPGEEVARLIRRADQALYAAKMQGRNRTFVHTGEQCQSVTPSGSGSQADRAAGSGHPSETPPCDQSRDDAELLAACDDLRKRWEEAFSGD